MGRKAKQNPEPDGGYWRLPSITRTMVIIGMPDDTTQQRFRDAL
jgi:hypothetical protein